MNQVKTNKRKSARHFLLLQGPQSTFFSVLAKKLRSQNFRTTKINFNESDELFYGKKAIRYNYSDKNWASYISDIARMQGVTDIVLFNEKTPQHASAVSELRKQGLGIHIFDDGYFGNQQISLRSQDFPQEPMFYMRAPTIHFDEEIEKTGFSLQKLQHIKAALASRELPAISPLTLARGLQQTYLQHALRDKNFFIAHLEETELHLADEIIASFAEHTNNTALVLSVPRKVKVREAKHHVFQLITPNLGTLIQNAEGLIVGSSNAGFIALENEKPLLALGDSIFNFAGLTNQSKLLGFWHRRVSANPTLYSKFKNHLCAKTQVNGSFYSQKGIKMAAEKAASQIIESGDFVSRNNVSENV